MFSRRQHQQNQSILTTNIHLVLLNYYYHYL